MMGCAVVLGAGWLLLQTPAPSSGGNMQPRLMQPTPKVQYTRGPPVEPSKELMAWLHKNADVQPLRLVRLPVTVELRPLGIEHASVGGVSIALQDSALGISLLDRARRACGMERNCTMWMMGYWTPLALLRVINRMTLVQG